MEGRIVQIKKTPENMAWYDEIRNIVDSYKEDWDEPLDGDEVERLSVHVKNRMNLMEGNITDEEFERLEEEC